VVSFEEFSQNQNDTWRNKEKIGFLDRWESLREWERI